MSAVSKTIPKKAKRPDLANQGACKILTSSTAIRKGSTTCWYQNHGPKSSPDYSQCRLKAAKLFIVLKPRNTTSWGIAMPNNDNKNVVKLFPKTGENSKSASRFETPFIKQSKPDGSPLTIVVAGSLAHDIRRDALSVGKDAAQYGAQGLAAWYGIEGGTV